MKRFSPRLSIFLAATVLCGLATPGVHAQEKIETVEDVKEKFAEDKTGTNPLNFTYDARLYNEYRWLNTPGDPSTGTPSTGSNGQNVTTFEQRVPFADHKWQFRIRVPHVGIKADLNGDGMDDVDESGLGDLNVRFMTIPVLNIPKRYGVALGVEAFFNTASEDALGNGATSLAPFVFFGYFNPVGPGSIFVPGYQHTISIDEDDGRSKVRQGLIDMFLVKTFNNNQYWGFIDPQIVLDYERNTEFMLLEFQAGRMFGYKAGHSAYIMPSFGIGNDRPYDFSLEIGYKIVW